MPSLQGHLLSWVRASPRNGPHNALGSSHLGPVASQDGRERLPETAQASLSTYTIQSVGVASRLISHGRVPEDKRPKGKGDVKSPLFSPSRACRQTWWPVKPGRGGSLPHTGEFAGSRPKRGRFGPALSSVESTSLCRGSLVAERMFRRFLQGQGTGVHGGRVFSPARETFPSPQRKAVTISSSALHHRPTWRAQVTHKFVLPRPGTLGQPEQGKTIPQPLLVPLTAWFLLPPVQPA